MRATRVPGAGQKQNYINDNIYKSKERLGRPGRPGGGAARGPGELLRLRGGRAPDSGPLAAPRSGGRQGVDGFVRRRAQFPKKRGILGHFRTSVGERVVRRRRGGILSALGAISPPLPGPGTCSWGPGWLGSVASLRGSGAASRPGEGAGAAVEGPSALRGDPDEPGHPRIASEEGPGSRLGTQSGGNRIKSPWRESSPRGLPRCRTPSPRLRNPR